MPLTTVKCSCSVVSCDLPLVFSPKESKQRNKTKTVFLYSEYFLKTVLAFILKCKIATAKYVILVATRGQWYRTSHRQSVAHRTPRWLSSCPWKGSIHPLSQLMTSCSVLLLKKAIFTSQEDEDFCGLLGSWPRFYRIYRVVLSIRNV